MPSVRHACVLEAWGIGKTGWARWTVSVGTEAGLMATGALYRLLGIAAGLLGQLGPIADGPWCSFGGKLGAVGGGWLGGLHPMLAPVGRFLVCPGLDDGAHGPRWRGTLVPDEVVTTGGVEGHVTSGGHILVYLTLLPRFRPPRLVLLAELCSALEDWGALCCLVLVLHVLSRGSTHGGARGPLQRLYWMGDVLLAVVGGALERLTLLNRVERRPEGLSCCYANIGAEIVLEGGDATELAGLESQVVG